ncbi:hypothetical protein [Nostoc sp. ChiQUE01b]|nr:hypothetical protein [Nostoc sp. ChiQUE01b]MDZ8258277.1 hypothetical protein [Nostoc sp. ChiQUE01b]
MSELETSNSSFLTPHPAFDWMPTQGAAASLISSSTPITIS